MPNFSLEQIKSVYDDLCKNPAFSINLRVPTDARIKRECINLYKKKHTQSDKQVLRNFLKILDDKDLGVALNREDVGKFKPVVKFLKGETKNPRDETIELIAWLIDFTLVDSVDTSSGQIENEYQPPKHSEFTDASSRDFKEVTNGETKNEDAQNPIHRTLTHSLFRRSITVKVCIMLLVFVGVGFLYWKNKTKRPTIAEDEQCMYWQGDHYEVVGCKVKIDHATVIALDEQKLKRLKRITRLDTIGEKDLGKVWYVKIKVDSAEFYTDSGDYPLNTQKRLLPMTPYILNKYILKKAVVD
jgi:hypothetical protein